MADLAHSFKAPFAEQLAFFKAKLSLPSERWDDIMGAAHDRAFIVAGAAKADLLQDLRLAVDKAISQGSGLTAFRADFANIIRRHGWDYTGPYDWRTRVIYATNMSSSYAAGRWAQLTDPDLLKVRPYWRYVHADGVDHPRPLHVSWHGLILRHDDPWWLTHYPPNGWLCHCRVVAASAREYDRAEADRKVSPTDGEWTAVDTAGVSHQVPVGIDFGFAHAPGANARTDLRELIDRKLFRLDAPIGAAMAAELAPLLDAERLAAWRRDLAVWRADGMSRGRLAVVGAIAPDTLGWLDKAHDLRPAGAEIVVRDDLVLGPKSRRHQQAGDALSEEEWRELPGMIKSPDRTYLDTSTGKLVLVRDVNEAVKVVVEFDAKVGRRKEVTNLVVTAFRMSPADEHSLIMSGRWVIKP